MAISKYIVKGKNGRKDKEKYELRIRLYDANGEFIKAIRKQGFDSAKEARAYEENLKEIKTGKKVSFDDAVKHYLEYYKSHNKFSSYRSTSNAVDLHILPFFKGKDIFKISPKNILDWKIKIQGKEMYSIGYLNKIRTQLLAIFNHLVKYFNLDKSPCAGLDTFKDKNKKQEMLFWTIDEFNDFIKVVDDPMHKLFFNVLFYTGIRKGEAQALQWKDINFEKGTLSVSNTWQNLGAGKYGLSSPKTINAYRTIGLDSKTLEGLKNQLIIAKEYHDYDNNFFIFGDIKPLSTSQISIIFINYLKLCESKRIRIHDLRHSNASLLISLGADIILITKRLGHASSKETYDTYGHLYPDKQDEIIKKIESVSNLCHDDNKKPSMSTDIKGVEILVATAGIEPATSRV